MNSDYFLHGTSSKNGEAGGQVLLEEIPRSHLRNEEV